jgi:hypothetical protein
LVGLVTGAFIFGERFFRDRPLVFVDAVKGKLLLRIKNAASQTILVRPIQTSTALGVAYGDDLIDTITAAAGTPFMLLIEGKGERCVHIIFRKEWSSLQFTERINFVIPWTFTATRWVWQRPIKLTKTVGELKELLAAR